MMVIVKKRDEIKQRLGLEKILGIISETIGMDIFAKMNAKSVEKHPWK